MKRRRPVIGITMDHERTSYALPFDYARSVLAAGGLPLAIPFHIEPALIPQVVDQFDGLLFSGGSDLDPKLYGKEQRHPKAVPLLAERQKFEFALLAEVERRRMPLLGICLGCQLLNVYRGGNLIQFIPDLTDRQTIEHRRRAGLSQLPSRHPVTIAADSLLGRTIGKQRIAVNTRHKQSIKQLGRGLRVVATAPDGIIEGIEDAGYPLFMGVQWHPENLHAEPEHLAPIRLLVQRAAAAKSVNSAVLR